MTNEEIDSLFQDFVDAIPLAALFLKHGNVSGGFEAHKECQDIALRVMDMTQEDICQLDEISAGKVEAMRMWPCLKPEI